MSFTSDKLYLRSCFLLVLANMQTVCSHATWLKFMRAHGYVCWCADSFFLHLVCSFWQNRAREKWKLKCSRGQRNKPRVVRHPAKAKNGAKKGVTQIEKQNDKIVRPKTIHKIPRVLLQVSRTTSTFCHPSLHHVLNIRIIRNPLQEEISFKFIGIWVLFNEFSARGTCNYEVHDWATTK